MGEEQDEKRTRLVVRQFADTMIFGVELRLAVEGVGVLLVTAALDRRLSTLIFSFNGIRKKLPLSLVRRVVVERQEFPPGESEHLLWHVVLELEGDQLCTFVFDGPDASREASYLGGCLHVLLLEAVAPHGGPQEEEGYAGKGGVNADIASLATRTPPEEQDPNQMLNSTRSVAGSTDSALLNCAAPELVAALLAAGVVPAEPTTAPATSEASATVQVHSLGRDLPPTLLAGQNSRPMRAAPALRA